MGKSYNLCTFITNHRKKLRPPLTGLLLDNYRCINEIRLADEAAFIIIVLLLNNNTLTANGC